MPFEKVSTSVLNEKAFEKAFKNTGHSLEHLDKESARTIIREVTEWNTISERDGEENYLHRNILKVLNRYELEGDQANAYNFMCVAYFHDVARQQAKEDELEAEIAEDKRRSTLEEASVHEAKLEHGEERYEKMLKDSE